MPRTNRLASSTGRYHVLARGIGQQRIFEQAEDYLQFGNYIIIKHDGANTGF